MTALQEMLRRFSETIEKEPNQHKALSFDKFKNTFSTSKSTDKLNVEIDKKSQRQLIHERYSNLLKTMPPSISPHETKIYKNNHLVSKLKEKATVNIDTHYIPKQNRTDFEFIQTKQNFLNEFNLSEESIVTKPKTNSFTLFDEIEENDDSQNLSFHEFLFFNSKGKQQEETKEIDSKVNEKKLLIVSLRARLTEKDDEIIKLSIKISELESKIINLNKKEEKFKINSLISLD